MSSLLPKMGIADDSGWRYAVTLDRDHGSDKSTVRVCARDDAIHGGDEQRVPVGIRRIEQMHRLFGDQLPDRAFATTDHPVVEGGVGFVALGQHERDHRVGDFLAKHARQPVAG